MENSKRTEGNQQTGHSTSSDRPPTETTSSNRGWECLEQDQFYTQSFTLIIKFCSYVSGHLFKENNLIHLTHKKREYYITIQYYITYKNFNY